LLIVSSEAIHLGTTERAYIKIEDDRTARGTGQAN
jgi:hypothetical protein